MQQLKLKMCITEMSVFPIFLFFILLLPVLGVEIDDCEPISCKKHGPKIQTPFRHKDRHPQDCGYPGFDVHCNEENETVLELPVSVELVVKKINYVSQEVHLYDPQKCLLQKLLYLNLSASPFHFSEERLYNFSLFNCSASSRDLDDYLIPCLGDSSYRLCANYDYLNFYDLTSCTKINEIPSVPWSIKLGKNEFQLSWSEPKCRRCETQRKRCSLKDYTRERHIQCKPMMNDGASNGTTIAGGALCSVVFIITFAAIFILCIRDKENLKKVENFLQDYRALKPTRFSYSDIRRITHQFSEKLGEGGYGIVYKGKLPNEINVAVKVLNNSKGNGEEFVNEVGTVGRVHHVNVVRLIGFCAEGPRRALVYEFLPNDSLEKFIFQAEGNSLCWEKLQDIALGIAKGIEYLHQGCDQRILHFDIKPHNILLDHNFNPKICDFGLAKLCPKEHSTVIMTAARGTMGYIAPEVLSRTFGKVSYKSDVYSFGMLLLEMVGGRKNVDQKVNTSPVSFLQWIYRHLNGGEDIWERIEEAEDGNIARKLSIVGLWCIQWHPTDRPSMKQVVQMLEGDEDNLVMPPNPFQDTNPANSTVGITERLYQTKLPLIIESK